MYRPIMVLAVAAAIGCGGDGSPASVVTCELQDSSTHWCYEIATSTLPETQVTSLQSACLGLASGQMTFRMNEGACPVSTLSGPRAGICTTASAKATETSSSIPWWYEGLPEGLSVKVTYYKPQVTSAMGESICTTSHRGTWTP